MQIASYHERATDIWPARQVLYLNDVYFCARDALRLLMYEADLACGLDFHGEVRVEQLLCTPLTVWLMALP